MKKVALVLFIIFSLTIILSSTTFATSLPISIVVNERILEFPDEQPFIDKNNRTQAPAKYIGEALGTTVIWDGKEQKAVFTFGNDTLEFIIGKKSYVIDGRTKQMDTTAILKEGRPFFPVKYIAEALGANVKWDGATKTVYINRTLETQVEEGQDVPDGTVVNNQAELLEAFRIASYTLQHTVVLKCNNYRTSDYSLVDLAEDKSGIYGVYNIRVNPSILGDVADLTAIITYYKAFKIQQAMKNEKASVRIAFEDKVVVLKVKGIIAQIIKDSMTDYEKELAIHDYLVLNYKYDYYNSLNNSIPDESYTSFGLLIKGTGVCQAYAETMEILLNSVGIECRMVIGTSKGQSHGWNIVKLENEYYMLDVTWNDPIPDEPGHVSYSYFNVTSNQLALDHEWDSSKWPIAYGTKYNYFVYNDLVVDNYSDFKQLVINKIKEGKRDIKVYIYDYDKYVYSNLQFIFEHYRGSVSHAVSEAKNTVFRIILK